MTGDYIGELREALAEQDHIRDTTKMVGCPHGVDDGACKECYMEQATGETK